LYPALENIVNTNTVNGDSVNSLIKSKEMLETNVTIEKNRISLDITPTPFHNPLRRRSSSASTRNSRINLETDIESLITISADSKENKVNSPLKTAPDFVNHLNSSSFRHPIESGSSNDTTLTLHRLSISNGPQRRRSISVLSRSSRTESDMAMEPLESNRSVRNSINGKHELIASSLFEITHCNQDILQTKTAIFNFTNMLSKCGYAIDFNTGVGLLKAIFNIQAKTVIYF
jgi:hypothetical protein